MSVSYATVQGINNHIEPLSTSPIRSLCGTPSQGGGLLPGEHRSAGRGGISLDAQRQQIVNYCNLHDLELVEVVVDGGQSGKGSDRPGFQRVLALLESGKAYGWSSPSSIA